MGFLVRYKHGSIFFYESREELIEDALSDMHDLSNVEIAEISTEMTTAGNRKETLEWKRPQRGGITW